eukprot:TRINITY_DN37365_c0_g1_i1.p1 TRINITY_DN37365_c0_g1~~TRINITY_DN37365_c0_g1_i1.p1  ORF type:complete len:289 (-),score=56.96 TRINITY_DN37365_c0_g1_i1:62-928(-)
MADRGSWVIDLLQGDWVNLENPEESYVVTGRSVSRSNASGTRNFPDKLVWEADWKSLCWGSRGRYYLETPSSEPEEVAWLTWGRGRAFRWRRPAGRSETLASTNGGGSSSSASAGRDTRKPQRGKEKPHADAEAAKSPPKNKLPEPAKKRPPPPPPPAPPKKRRPQPPDTAPPSASDENVEKRPRPPSQPLPPGPRKEDAPAPRGTVAETLERRTVTNTARGPEEAADAASKSDVSKSNQVEGKDAAPSKESEGCETERLIARSILSSGFRPMPDPKEDEELQDDDEV